MPVCGVDVVTLLTTGLAKRAKPDVAGAISDKRDAWEMQRSGSNGCAFDILQIVASQQKHLFRCAARGNDVAALCAQLEGLDADLLVPIVAFADTRWRELPGGGPGGRVECVALAPLSVSSASSSLVSSGSLRIRSSSSRNSASDAPGPYSSRRTNVYHCLVEGGYPTCGSYSRIAGFAATRSEGGTTSTFSGCAARPTIL